MFLLKPALSSNSLKRKWVCKVKIPEIDVEIYG